MRAGERLIAQDGYEVALFPCEAMYVTQGPHDVLALDFGPRDTSGNRISPMNCYAPFTGTIVYTGNDHNCILESDNLVHWPDGRLAKMRVLVAHSWVAPTLNAHYTQGDLFYQTGNYGLSSGEHLHMECALAQGNYWRAGGIGLNNGVNMWLCLFKNDTVILNGGGYNWIDYEGGITPTPTEGKRKRFPWVLYARKLRNR